jgi:hypothetical protein
MLRRIALRLRVSDCSLENYALGEKEAMFLKPSRGTMSVSAVFKDVVVMDTFLGCRLSVRMGRLDCSTAPYNIRITSTTTVASVNSGVNFHLCGEWLMLDSTVEETSCNCECPGDGVIAYGGECIYIGTGEG